MTRLSERVKMSMTADMRFKILITDDIYTNRSHIKLDAGMFRMLQFTETPKELILDTLDEEKTDVARVGLHNRRFYGFHSVQDKDKVAGLHIEQFSSQLNQRAAKSSGSNDGQKFESDFISSTSLYDPQYAVYTAQMCCADSNRLREIVFVTDLMVRSEAQAGSSYKRFLCDYQILNPTTFGYSIEHRRDHDPYHTESNFITTRANVQEVLPSHRYYASENASAGRWQELTSPEPLHDIEVRAMVKTWSYEENKYELEDIRLPAGSQFSVKLIFVSKENQAVAVVEKPDKYHT